MYITRFDNPLLKFSIDYILKSQPGAAHEHHPLEQALIIWLIARVCSACCLSSLPPPRFSRDDTMCIPPSPHTSTLFCLFLHSKSLYGREAHVCGKPQVNHDGKNQSFPGLKFFG